LYSTAIIRVSWWGGLGVAGFVSDFLSLSLFLFLFYFFRNSAGQGLHNPTPSNDSFWE
jgi:hypothetical protein